MYPVLPFGPFTIPTSPVIILIATTIGLELAGRIGRRFSITVDDTWNIGLIAILAGLIVARLWNVIQFWPVYLAEPWLITSLRPSGFVLLPGIIAAIIVAYVYLLRYALAPLPVFTALVTGAVIAWAIIQAGGMLTGQIVGNESDVPWAINYFTVSRHPVSLYYGIGLATLVSVLWRWGSTLNPRHFLLLLLTGVGIVYLFLGAFEYDTSLIGGIRLNQLVGLLIAFLSAIGLSWQK